MMNINQLTPPIRATLTWCLALALSLTASLSASLAYSKTNEVTLLVEAATPVLSSNERQTAFLKISLTGFKLDKPQADRAPTNIAIVLDKSGSMAGEKIDRAREAAILAVNMLGPNDIVSIVTYESTVDVVVPATKVRDKDAIRKKIRNIRTQGSTALFAGVSKGAAELRKFIDKNRVNRVILLSDGLANVGPHTSDELGQLGLSLSKEGMSVTTIGLGLHYNEDLMTLLASYSDGNHAFVEDADDLAKIFALEFGDVLSVIAQGVDVSIHCRDGVRPIRILGRDSQITGNKITTRFNQLYSEQEKYFVLEVEVPARPARESLELVDVSVTYNNIVSKRTDKLSGGATVKFSQEKAVIRSAINARAYEDSVEQIANEVSKDAIKLRDKGDIAGAKQLMKSNASYLRRESKRINSEKLMSQQQEMLDEAEQVENEDEWKKNRKRAKEKQYRRSKQQSY
ncbi:MAG: hypothetical protein COA42_10915 [Alteromonadaceae bacterium]|nr:MAG: hypothetical protein COA42_10915 [Alteromonadaceae bacterium]